MATATKTPDKKTPSTDAKAKKPAVTIDNSPEGKAKRFKVIAGRRTALIIKTIGNLSNCSNRNIYAYNKEKVDYIFDSIEKAVKATKEKFAEKIDEGRKVEFKMPD